MQQQGSGWFRVSPAMAMLWVAVVGTLVVVLSMMPPADAGCTHGCRDINVVYSDSGWYYEGIQYHCLEFSPTQAWWVVSTSPINGTIAPPIGQTKFWFWKDCTAVECTEFPQDKKGDPDALTGEKVYMGLTTRNECQQPPEKP